MRILSLFVVAIFFVLNSGNQNFLQGEDYYVSTKGKGKTASREKPAKDLGNIVSKLKAGDTIHIAGGTYFGRGECGTCVINVPVKIIGGYDESFASRDPWGKHRTVLSGKNLSKNWQPEPGLFIDLMKYRGRETHDITIDGIIVDHGDRNRYASAEQNLLVRAASPKTGDNPSPESGGIVVRASKVMSDASWNIVVKNCIVTNTAPTQGALSVSGHKNSKIKIENNIIINNTGTGISLGSNYQGRDGSVLPTFEVANNTVLFTWKHGPMSQSFSGNSILAGDNVVLKAKGNLFAFADKIGINNEAKISMQLNNNLILGNVLADYLEFDTKIDLDDIEDEADHIHEESEGNVAEKIKIPVSKKWAEAYGSRVLIDRRAVEADIKVQQTAANEIRSILGLPVRAGTVEGPAVSVWLNRLSIDDAVAAGAKKYLEKFGSSTPQL